MEKNNNNINNSINNTEVINLRELLTRYVQKWYWFVLAVIIAFIVATIYLRKTDNKYQVQTVILLRNEDNSSQISQLAMMESFGLMGSSRVVDDEIQVINSNKIINQVIDTLGIEVEYFEKTGLKYVEKYHTLPFKLNLVNHFADSLKAPIRITLKTGTGSVKVSVKYGRDWKNTYTLDNIQQPFSTPAGVLSLKSLSSVKPGMRYKINVYPKKDLLAQYRGKLNVSVVNKQSNAIRISIVEFNIKKAEDILNKIVELYNMDAIIDKNIVAANTGNFIEDRLRLITKELFDVESEVESYKKANSLTDIASEAGIYLASASEYEKKIAELETQLNLIQYIESYIRDAKNQYSLIPANIGVEDKSLMELILNYNAIVLERMKLSQSANEKNPVLIQIEQQIKALRGNVLESIGSVKSGLKIAKNDVTRKDAQFNSRIKAVPTQERQFLEIKRQQEIKQNLYLFLAQKREENALSLASTAPAARTIDRAYPSLTPVSPKRMIIYLVALILGLLFPFLYIYLRDLINNKIEDAKEFQKTVNPPFLGSICISRDSDRVVVQAGKTTPIVEMFRLVRTNLQFIIGSKKNPAILITSSISGEGKSFISINTAMSLALLNKKVVLIGMDIRNPVLRDYMHLSNVNSNGVTLYLSDTDCQIGDIIMPSGYNNNLDVIPAGPVPPNPSELLLSSRLDELVRELKKIYDYIIIDSAPIGIVSDTYLLNRVIDNCIYVARQDHTPREASNLINEIYAEKRLNGMALILNGTSATSSYGYGYGYERNKNKFKNMPKLTFGDKLNNAILKLFKRN